MWCARMLTISRFEGVDATNRDIDLKTLENDDIFVIRSRTRGSQAFRCRCIFLRRIIKTIWILFTPFRFWSLQINLVYYRDHVYLSVFSRIEFYLKNCVKDYRKNFQFIVKILSLKILIKFNRLFKITLVKFYLLILNLLNLCRLDIYFNRD